VPVQDTTRLQTSVAATCSLALVRMWPGGNSLRWVDDRRRRGPDGGYVRKLKALALMGLVSSDVVPGVGLAGLLIR
jgi:hypothetical protein